VDAREIAHLVMPIVLLANTLHWKLGDGGKWSYPPQSVFGLALIMLLPFAGLTALALFLAGIISANLILDFMYVGVVFQQIHSIIVRHRDRVFRRSLTWQQRLDLDERSLPSNSLFVKFAQSKWATWSPFKPTPRQQIFAALSPEEKAKMLLGNLQQSDKAGVVVLPMAIGSGIGAVVWVYLGPKFALPFAAVLLALILLYWPKQLRSIRRETDERLYDARRRDQARAADSDTLGAT
jgi:hypothetical protein